MERKIVEYEILQDNHPQRLNEIVKKMINLGWQPLRAPFHIEINVYQAMVKYELSKSSMEYPRSHDYSNPMDIAPAPQS